MSNDTILNQTRSALVALLMASVVLAAIPVASADAVSPSQQTIVDAALGETPDEWQDINEFADFYLQSEPGDLPILTIPGLLGVHSMSTERPRLGTVPVLTGGTPLDEHATVALPGTAGTFLSFPAVGGLVAQDEIHLHGFQSTMFFSGVHVGLRIVADVYDLDPVSGDAVAIAGFTLEPILDLIVPTTGSTVQATPLEYAGSVDLGINGYVLPEGHTLELRLSTRFADVVNAPASAGLPAILHFDTNQYRSVLRVAGESSELNIWTVDSTGKITDSFLAGSHANVLQRQVNVRVLHASHWGAQDCLPGVNEVADACPIDNLDQTKHTLRVRDMNPGSPSYLSLVNLFGGFGAERGAGTISDDQVLCCNLGPEPIQYTLIDGEKGLALFEYTLVYAPEILDGVYRIEVYESTKNWVASQIIKIGSTEFDLELAPFEDAEHIVAIGQSTEFHLRLANAGGGTGIFALSTPLPGEGWTATISPGTVTLGPGDSTEIIVRVVPAIGAASGDSKTIVVTAANLVDNRLKSLALTTTVTDTATFAVDLVSEVAALQVRPGLVASVPIGLRNIGTVGAGFITSAAGLPSGWVGQVHPSFAEVSAGATQAVVLQLTVPSDAVPGSVFVMTVETVRAGNAATAASLPIEVEVIVLDDLSLLPRDGGRYAFRDEGNLACDGFLGICDFLLVGLPGGATIDPQFDDAVPYRILVSNTGDRTDTFNLFASWVPDPRNGIDDVDCETSSGNTRDGIPDGWRYRLLAENGVTSTVTAFPASPQYGVSAVRSSSLPFSGEAPLGSVELAAGEQRYVYVELHFVEPDDPDDQCTSEPSGNNRFDLVAQQASLRVDFRSTNDPALKRHIVLSAALEGNGEDRFASGDYPSSRNAAALELALDESPEVPVADDTLEGFVDLIASNVGNEQDGLRVRLGSSALGWSYTIDSFEVLQSAVRTYGSPPVARACTLDTTATLICDGMGVYDEVALRVKVMAAPGAAVGDVDTLVVTASSTGFAGAGQAADSITLKPRVQGDFQFTLQSLDNELNVEPGRSASFPFQLTQIGTEATTVEITVEEGSADWAPGLSSAVQVGLPSGSTHSGFLTVNAPLTATPGSQEHFRLKFRDLNSGQTELLDFFADVVALSGLSFSSVPTTIGRGTTGGVDVVITDLADTATTADTFVRPATLPTDWTLVCGTDASCTNPALDTSPFTSPATVDYFLTAPAQLLGTSRFPLRVNATTNTALTGEHDAIINAAKEFGLQILTPNGVSKIVPPGYPADHVIQVLNAGNVPLTVQMSASGVTSGWTVSFDSDFFTLQPQEKKNVKVTPTAPAQGVAGVTTSFVVVANSVEDAAVFDQETLFNTIGLFAPALSAPTATQYMAPQDRLTLTVDLTNSGDVFDTISLNTLLPTAYRGLFVLEYAGCDRVDAVTSNCLVDLLPGNTTQVQLKITAPDSIVSAADVSLTMTAASTLSKQGAQATQVVPMKILAHVVIDADLDGTMEYAVDRNRDSLDGFETFKENQNPGGLTARVPELAKFLTDEARARKTVEINVNGTTVQVLRYNLDGDFDGRRDFLLDINADDLPDIYFDPDARVVDNIELTKDVTKDGVREYFIDNDGDGKLDVWFDITEGEFGKLIQVDADGDDKTDYIVDLNGNGQADQGEPVILGISTGTTIVEAIDVDGDGILDQVFDTDGDGLPEYFLSSLLGPGVGAIQITLKEVTGDNVRDWAYDLDGDGKLDSYYDPVTGETGSIDEGAAFWNLFKRYWYVSALFFLVAGLFVVLLVVTRR